jgi:hypothetical protein
MCWNWQVSLTAWIISVICCFVLFMRRKRNDVVFGLLLLFYSSIQFWEFLMWISQDCGQLNWFATYGAYFALYSHVFAVGLGIWIEQGRLIPLIVGLLWVGIAFVDGIQKKMGCSKPAKDCRHLYWGFNTDFYKFVFATGIILALIYIRPLSSIMVVSLLFILSYGFSLLFSAKGGVASFWCFISVIVGPVFIWLNR